MATRTSLDGGYRPARGGSTASTASRRAGIASGAPGPSTSNNARAGASPSETVIAAGGSPERSRSGTTSSPPGTRCPAAPVARRRRRSRARRRRPRSPRTPGRRARFRPPSTTRVARCRRRERVRPIRRGATRVEQREIERAVVRASGAGPRDRERERHRVRGDGAERVPVESHVRRRGRDEHRGDERQGRRRVQCRGGSLRVRHAERGGPVGNGNDGRGAHDEIVDAARPTCRVGSTRGVARRSRRRRPSLRRA